MARALPQGAGGALSYFTRHRTLANLLLVILIVGYAYVWRRGALQWV